MENNLLTIEQINEIISEKNVKKLRLIFEEVDAIDIAEVCNKIDNISELLFIFKTVKSEYTAELFAYLDSEQQEKLISAFSDKEITELIDNSFTDDIVDFIEDLPANLVNRVLNASSKDMRTHINHLLNYKEGTAGSIMTTEYVQLKSTITAEEALKKIRKDGKNAESIYSTFVVDEKRNLVGVLYLEELIYAEPEALVADIMNKEFKTANVSDDQEDVVTTFKRYDLHILPVLNQDQRLVGMITIDDIVDVIEDEASEDIEKMAGLQPLDDTYFKTSAPKMASKRVTWLLILMISATFTSMIISKFESSLQKITILSAFIPMLMDTSGNAGGQTTSLITRGLATKEFTTRDYLKVLWKEFRVALIAGLIVAVANFLWIFLELSIGLVEPSPEVQNWQIAALVASTLFITILFSKTVGASLPMLAKKLHLDPALMSGPLVTTIVDAIALITYFTICTQILHLV